MKDSYRYALSSTHAAALTNRRSDQVTFSPQTTRLLLIITILITTIGFLDSVSADTILKGVPAVCENEGEKVDVPLISHGGGEGGKDQKQQNCAWSCVCKNRQIVCEKERCRSNQGCYMVLVEQKKKCCNVCKGCVYNGTAHESGAQWRDSKDPCQTFHCQAGIVTISRQQCFAPCGKPKPPEEGQCCPSCQGCQLSGTQFRDGHEFVLEDDRCVRCKCTMSSLACHKQACPVLSCPASKVVHKPNTCCPECSGIREVYDWKRRCLIDNKFYNHGEKFKTDNCTSCTCNGSTAVCDRESCSPLPCTHDSQYIPEGECCHRCKATQEVVNVCQVAGGHKYKEGATWKPDSCTTCECWKGKSRCLVDQCKRIVDCPRGHKVELRPGSCCPKCIEEDAVCTVFGDPHYRTFDKRVFHFQGSCKYVLTEDCVSRSFSVRVRNDARHSRSFSWTKSVFVKLNQTKVVLLQHMKVKVDGKQVITPYSVPGVLSVTQEGYSVVVRTELGISLLWDGDSFLEVSLRPKYKGKVCGLCGNYNKDGGDDFRTRKGRLVNNAFKFGTSWQIGGKRYCNRPRIPSSSSNREQTNALCKASWDNRIRGSRTCNALKSKVFAPCRHLVNPNTYLRLCMLDMCECPSNKSCYCEVLMAYAHECARKGVILDWRNATNCTGPPCRKGAVYNPCGSACPVTCENRRLVERVPCQKPCVPGCHCPSGTFLHRKRCVAADKCPPPKQPSSSASTTTNTTNTVS